MKDYLTLVRSFGLLIPADKDQEIVQYLNCETVGEHKKIQKIVDIISTV
jgi:IS5 family transposase